MRAVVLVGGEGTRLRPLTETIPKPLVPLMDRATLDHVLDHLGRHGVHEVVLSSSYLEETFRSFIEARRGDPAITWITEDVPLDTGGAIVNALAALGWEEPFLALNGDIITDLDLNEMIAFHRERRAVATIALTHVVDARPFGLVPTENDGRVSEFREKPTEPLGGSVNAGTYVLRPDALTEWEAAGRVNIEREIFPALIEQGWPVYGFESRAYWIDLGTPAKYLQAHFDILDGKVGFEPNYDSPFIAEGARADDAGIGPHVVVCAGAVVGRDAVVEDTVVHGGAVIEEAASVNGSILGPRSRVGARAVVRDLVLAEGASVPPGAKIEGGRISAGQVAASTERTGAPDRMG
jgi:NDP-sugar pyrophosphorylase family protein